MGLGLGQAQNLYSQVTSFVDPGGVSTAINGSPEQSSRVRNDERGRKGCKVRVGGLVDGGQVGKYSIGNRTTIFGLVQVQVKQTHCQKNYRVTSLGYRMCR